MTHGRPEAGNHLRQLLCRLFAFLTMFDRKVHVRDARHLLACAFCFLTAIGSSAVAQPQGRSSIDADVEAAQAAEIQRLENEERAAKEKVRRMIESMSKNDPRRQQMSSMLEAIEDSDRLNERTLYVNAKTTDESALAYQKDVRDRIERAGTSNFPVVDGHKLYGDVWLILRITQDGKLQSARVARSSGNAALDQKATSLAQESGPFPPFDASLREKWEAIALVTGFHFKHDPASQPSH